MGVFFVGQKWAWFLLTQFLFDETFFVTSAKKLKIKSITFIL